MTATLFRGTMAALPGKTFSSHIPKEGKPDLIRITHIPTICFSTVLRDGRLEKENEGAIRDMPQTTRLMGMSWAMLEVNNLIPGLLRVLLLQISFLSGSSAILSMPEISE